MLDERMRIDHSVFPSRIISVKTKLFILSLIDEGVDPKMINTCIDKAEQLMENPLDFMPTRWHPRFNYVWDALAADLAFRL